MKTIYKNIRKGILIYSTLFVSLVVAFTTMILILAFNFSEYDVDSFHTQKDRIFRLLSDDPWTENAQFPYITKEAPAYIKSTFPEVVDFCQWNKNGYERIEVNGNTFYRGFDIFDTDQSFFKIFSYKLKEGDINNLLKSRYDIIITEETAHKFFGDGEAVGKPIIVRHRNETKTYTVASVIELPSKKSHLKFDMLTSIEGKDLRGCQAYMLLKEGADPSDFEKKLQAHKSEIPFFGKGASVNYYLESLTDVYLNKEVKTKIIIYFMIALLILLVAFFNYTNLLITQIKGREADLNIRRVIGGSFIKITLTFLREPATLIFASLIVSLACAEFIRPQFNRINETGIRINDLASPVVIGLLVAVALFLLVLSSLIIYFFVRQRNVKKTLIHGKTNQFALINTFQFAISIILIICTIVVFRQIEYIHTKDIGLNRDVLEMRMPPFDGDKSFVFKELLLKSPAVEEVSVCGASPVREGAMVLFTYDVDGEKKEYSPLYFQGDNNYISTLGINLVEGNNFYKVEQQNKNKCLVNQAMVRYFGFDSPIGQILPGSKLEIIGVVKDFHWTSIESVIPPSIIAQSNSGANILVKVNPEIKDEALSYIGQSWKEIIPDYPFEYSTIGDSFNQKHKKYDVLVRFIAFFCLLAISLSVIGLFARSISTVKSRTKEIGIRKVNGAKISELMVMLNKNFVIWVLLAFVIAGPVAWYAMHKWLQNFAYKTTLSWWIFALAGLLALGIALLTVSWQSWKAATKNPVDALRYE